jgi:hypothetical protein
MSRFEKLSVLRARALALRQRAVWLAGQFTTPSTRSHVDAVILRLDDELAWLENATAAEELPRLSRFLPKTTERLEALAELLRTQGRHALPRADMANGLDERRRRERHA